jgi:hypothetical protein
VNHGGALASTVVAGKEFWLFFFGILQLRGTRDLL